VVNSIDVVIIIIIFAGAYMGYYRGFLAEVITLVGVIFGISMATKFYLQIDVVLLPLLRDQQITSFIAFLVVYWAGVLVFFLIHMVVKSNMAYGSMGSLSRLLAVLLGAFKSAVFVAMVLFLVIFFWGPENYLTAKAKLTPRYLPRCRIVLKLMPETMQESLEEFLNELSTKSESEES
jgi:membrane protein required for colicin V production